MRARLPPAVDRAMRAPWAGLIVAAAGVLAAALPLLVAALAPAADDPTRAFARLDAWGRAGRLAGLALAAAGAALLLLAAHRAGPRAAPPLTLIAAAAGILAILLVSPTAREWTPQRVEDEYAQSGVLAPVPGQRLDAPPPRGHDFGVLHGETQATDTAGPLTLGPFHAQRHDVWRVGVVVRRGAWEEDGTPVISASVPLGCVPYLKEDARGTGGSPTYVEWWTCVVREDGEAAVTLTLPGRVPGDVLLLASVLPTADLALAGPLDETLAGIAGLTLGGAGGGALLARRRLTRGA